MKSYKTLFSHRSHNAAHGFTLIELSIVLVIIGLIVGGVLVGQDLIKAAAVRAQITQIQQYQQAVTTFQGKYGFLPGDIKDPEASNFGFRARSTSTGQGDGDGILIGYVTTPTGMCVLEGETAVFWLDLSVAHLIAETFTLGSPYARYYGNATVSGTQIQQYIPQAAIGSGNYVYVYSGGTYGSSWNSNGVNYFGLSAVSSIVAGNNGEPASTPKLTVKQAYSIDMKMDDGSPNSGRVATNYVDGSAYNYRISSAYSATSGSSTTCSDSNGVGGGIPAYSLTQNNGNGANCALSFTFQ